MPDTLLATAGPDAQAAPRRHGRGALSSPAMPQALLALALIAPALATVACLFLAPLALSVAGAFDVGGAFGLGNLVKAFELYGLDIAFTIAIVALSAALTALLSIAIAGYLVLGENRTAVAALRWLYRWPLFIPYIVVGQLLRTFLAKNGLMNNVLVGAGLLGPLDTVSYLDWRGIVAAFVWKQTPFVTLLLAGALASLDRATLEAARNLGASRLRILVEIALPQAAPSLFVGLTLSIVTIMSVLSVPLMINAQSPTMITADIAFRINAYGDYPVADALGLVSFAITAGAAWLYLRHSLAEGRR